MTKVDTATTEKPVTHFEVGKWYRWVGPKERNDLWNDDGKMDAVLDGTPRLCSRAEGMIAEFKGIPSTSKALHVMGNGGAKKLGEIVAIPLSNVELTTNGFIIHEIVEKLSPISFPRTQERRAARARLLSRI